MTHLRLWVAIPVAKSVEIRVVRDWLYLAFGGGTHSIPASTEAGFQGDWLDRRLLQKNRGNNPSLTDKELRLRSRVSEPVAILSVDVPHRDDATEFERCKRVFQAVGHYLVVSGETEAFISWWKVNTELVSLEPPT